MIQPVARQGRFVLRVGRLAKSEGNEAHFLESQSKNDEILGRYILRTLHRIFSHFQLLVGAKGNNSNLTHP